MLSRVCHTKLGGLHFFLDFRVLGEINLVGLNSLGPTNVVETFSKENNESQHDTVEGGVGLQRDFVQIHGKCFVDQHLVPGRLIKVHVSVVVMTPAFLLPVETVSLQLWWLIGCQFLLLLIVIFSVGDISLVLCLIMLLVFLFVSATKFEELGIQRVLL